MSERLGQVMRAAAERVPPAAVPPDLFDRARARHRRRLAARAAAGAVVLLLLGLGYALGPAAGMTGGVSAAAGGPALPGRLSVPPLRTATVGQSPPGAAAAIFGGSATTDDWNEGRFGVVAAEADRYRVAGDMPYRPPGFEALLSPDGRYLAAGGTVTDLTDGDESRLRFVGEPLAFSPDGRLLVSSSGTDDQGQRPYATVSRVDGGGQPVRLAIDGQWLIPGWSAAVSPDNSTVALQIRQEVWLTRLDGPADGQGAREPYLKLRLDRGGRLAGPGAWLPGGRTLAVASRAGDGWRLSVFDARLGLEALATNLPELPATRYVRVVGWRSRDTALATVGLPAPGATPTMDDFDNEWGPYHDPQALGVRLVALHRGAAAPEVLLATPPRVTELDVAADLAIAGKVRPAGPPSYGPPHPLFLAGGLCLAAPLVLVALLVGRQWRRRRGRPTPPTILERSRPISDIRT